jgi:hypothetical protein
MVQSMDLCRPEFVANTVANVATDLAQRPLRFPLGEQKPAPVVHGSKSIMTDSASASALDLYP